jgi:GNAT superfamily N-acetyltransferase
MTKRVTVSAEIDDATAKTIEDGLTRFNELHLGADHTKPVWLVCRDDHGCLLGGLQGFIQGDWFAIATLWVHEEHRGRGIGRRLLLDAEAFAREHGCTRARLGTMTFQAPDFYSKHSYVEVCRLHDVPPGHAFVFMTKSLVG